LVFLQVQTHLRRNFSFARRASKPRRENADRFFGGSSFASQIARAPVERTQAVKDGAANAELRVAAELDFLPRIEFGEGVHQANDSGRNQIFNIHVLREPLVNAAGEKTYDRKMFQ